MSFCTTLFLAVGIVSVASQEAPSIASDGNGNIVIDVGDNGDAFLARAGGQEKLVTAQSMATEFAVREAGDKEHIAEATLTNNAQDETIADLTTRLTSAEAAMKTMTSMLNAMSSTVEDLKAALSASADAQSDAEMCQQSLVNAGSSSLKGCPKPDAGGAAGCKEYPDLKNGQALGHGNVKGAVRILGCNFGYNLISVASSGTVVCNTDGKWSDNDGASKCESTTTTTTVSTTTTITTTTTVNWMLVYRQKECKHDGSDQGAASDDCYGALSQIKDNRKVDGTFRFKMVYPGKHPGRWSDDDEDLVSPEMVWSQTSEPMSSNDRVSDYMELNTNSDVFWNSGHRTTFNGLALSQNRATLLDGHHPEGNWFYSLGSPYECFPGSPAFNTLSTGVQEGCGCEEWAGTCFVELYVEAE